MKYYLRQRTGSEINGPFPLFVIRLKLESGEITGAWEATGDIGETLVKLKKLKPRDWMRADKIPYVFTAETPAPHRLMEEIPEDFPSTPSTHQEQQEACDRCGSHQVTKGSLGYRASFTVPIYFCPEGERHWARQDKAGVMLTVHADLACLACGHVKMGGQASPAKLQAFLTDNMTEAVRKGLGIP